MIKLKNCCVGVKQQSLTQSLVNNLYIFYCHSLKREYVVHKIMICWYNLMNTIQKIMTDLFKDYLIVLQDYNWF
jgi:hypothetical protein